MVIQNLEFYGVLLIFLIAFVALRENRRNLRDQEKVDIIIAEGIAAHGLGLAVMNRLKSS